MKMLWTASTHNSKTGPIPSAYIGETFKEMEESCGDCPQFGNKKLGISRKCYAYNGLVNMAARYIHKGFKKNKGKGYSLSEALSKRHKSAKSCRIGVIGEPTAIGLKAYKNAVKQIRKEGLAVLSYTHQWRKLKAQFWKSNIMASCDKLEEVDQAVVAGFRAAVILPPNFRGKSITTPSGHLVITCPAIWTSNLGLPEDKLSTCNSCRLCDASRSGPHIGFPAHGPAFRKAKKLPVV